MSFWKVLGLPPFSLTAWSRARGDVLALLLARCEEGIEGGGSVDPLKRKNSLANQREMFVMGKQGLYKSIHLYKANASQERAGEMEAFVCALLWLLRSFICQNDAPLCSSLSSRRHFNLSVFRTHTVGRVFCPICSASYFNGFYMTLGSGSKRNQSD